MFRFTIRDLLWLMVVVGLLAAWNATADDDQIFSLQEPATQHKLFSIKLYTIKKWEQRWSEV
jgi:hypothetical protein